LLRDLDIRQLRDARDPGVLRLVSKSDEYLDALYPPESNHAESLDLLIGENSRFYVAYLGSELVACGAVKLVSGDEPYGEIKRVFVAAEHRGKQIATAVMQHLENVLFGLGTRQVRLEAGPLQPAAIKLYRKMGYVVRGPFGAYDDDPLSIFMEKDLQK